MKHHSLQIFSPAKINLFLAVMGEREDGFHEVLSLVAKVKFGDRLEIALVEGMQDQIECDNEDVPVGRENLIMKAIMEIRQRYEFSAGVKVKLNKRIPMGAGFGGGSSNGVAVLKGLDRLLGGVFDKEEMKKIAMCVGSDCPLFLEEGLVVIRGRGEESEKVVKELGERIRGQRVIIFKPEYSINTGWAYKEMKKNPEHYLIKKDAEVALSTGIERLINGNELASILYNNFEHVIFMAYPDLRQMMTILYQEYQVEALLSGSGSGCFFLLKEDSDVRVIKKRIQEILGKSIFLVETAIK